jgi:NAD-dependent DNA ligase
MRNFFLRQSIEFKNNLKQSIGALVGIAQGILSDGRLNDEEIYFLSNWLNNNASISTAWPGNVVAARIKEALQDGSITEDERRHLVETLQDLIGGDAEDLHAENHVTELALDKTATVSFDNKTFCLTGEFLFAPRSNCEAVTEKRGGIISKNVSKKIDFLVVGGLGSKEWKHGSFGLKVEKAMELKQAGHKLLVVHEDQWAASL